MPTGDGTYSHGSANIRITGLSKTLRKLSAAGADAQDMKQLMFSIGNLVVRAANPPVLTGRTAATIRAGKGKTKAVVRAGGARAPYAGVVHYGWPERNIKPHPYLLEALQKERPDVLRKLDEGIDQILKQNDLK